MSFKSYKISKGIIEAMVESNLDPVEFYNFMKKYAEFIKLGLVMKKMYAAGTPEFDEINKEQALSAGIRCFDSFLFDFDAQYKQRLLQKKPKKK
jgi:hypothetical protein